MNRKQRRAAKASCQVVVADDAINSSMVTDGTKERFLKGIDDFQSRARGGLQ